MLNASTNGFLTIQLFQNVAQPLQLISVDGIPLTTPNTMTTISIPPAGRVEFITPALVAGTPALFLTQGFDTGPIGDPMSAGNLANVVVTNGSGREEIHTAAVAPKPTEAPRFSGLGRSHPP